MNLIAFSVDYFNKFTFYTRGIYVKQKRSISLKMNSKFVIPDPENPIVGKF